MTTYLEGPVSISNHVRLGKRPLEVIVLGDYHQKVNSCDNKKQNVIKVSDLFSSLAQKHPQKILDFYLEVQFVSTQRPKRSASEHVGYLFGDTFKRYEKCLQVDKKSCDIPNARFHYIDVRQTSKELQSLEELHQLVEILLNAWKNSPALDPENPVEAFKFQLDVEQFNDGKSSFWDLVKAFRPPDESSLEGRSAKELSSGLDEDEKYIIQKYLEYKLYYKHSSNVIIENIKNIKDHLPKGPATVTDFKFIEMLIERLYYYETNNVSSLAAVQDAYLLARMLRDPPKNPKDRARYAVIYVGEDHAKALRSLLKKLSFIEVYDIKSTADYNQCLDISKLKLDF